jgi:hypothetical protein
VPTGRHGGGFHTVGFSFLILISILLLILTEEGEEIKIKIRSKNKRGTHKCGMRPIERKTHFWMKGDVYLLVNKVNLP